MIFFVLTGGFIGTFSNLLTPLQIGARDMASPLINMLPYWFFFLAGAIMFASLFIDTGPAASGWTSYPPLSALPQATRGSLDGMTFWIVSMVFFIVSTLLGSLDYIVTVINLRTQGMLMRRLRLLYGRNVYCDFKPADFSCVFLFAAPVFDRTFFTNFFMNDIFIGGHALSYSGGSPILFQHLFWFLGHPEVYIAIFPAFGIVSEVLSINAQTYFWISGHGILHFLILILSFMVWPTTCSFPG